MFWQVPVPAGYGCSQLCGGGVTSLYAWAPPAEPLRFPEGTATVIGSAVGTPYVLLEAHLVLDGEGAALHGTCSVDPADDRRMSAAWHQKTGRAMG